MYGNGKESRHKEGIAWSLRSLGVATLNLGDRIKAKSFFEECFSLFQEFGDTASLAENHPKTKHTLTKRTQSNNIQKFLI